MNLTLHVKLRGDGSVGFVMVDFDGTSATGERGSLDEVLQAFGKMVVDAAEGTSFMPVHSKQFHAEEHWWSCANRKKEEQR